jgi:hypothetical protein
MSDPFLFDTASPRFGLPLLFPGQAQKEAFVNEAHALVDALLHCAVEGEASAPPASPAEGTNWLVGEAPSGDWAGHAGDLACRQAGNWLFVTPRDGLRLLDRATGQQRLYSGGWQIPEIPGEPSGGSVVYSEARLTIVALLSALRVAGIFPGS